MCKNKLGEPVYLIILLFLLCNASHAGFETIDALLANVHQGICVTGFFGFLKIILNSVKEV